MHFTLACLPFHMAVDTIKPNNININIVFPLDCHTLPTPRILKATFAFYSHTLHTTNCIYIPNFSSPPFNHKFTLQNANLFMYTLSSQVYKVFNFCGTLSTYAHNRLVYKTSIYMPNRIHLQVHAVQNKNRVGTKFNLHSIVCRSQCTLCSVHYTSNLKCKSIITLIYHKRTT